MNIFAFTELHPNIPAYVSLNDDKGQAKITVRQRGGGCVATVPMDDEQLEKLAANIQLYLAHKAGR